MCTLKYNNHCVLRASATIIYSKYTIASDNIVITIEKLIVPLTTMALEEDATVVPEVVKL